MNLKTTCKTAFALAIFSVIFTTIGNFWIYLPTIVRTPHFESIVYVAGVILTSMFIGIGLVLLIFSSLLKSHHQSVCLIVSVLAGICVLLGTLIAIALCWQFRKELFTTSTSKSQFDNVIYFLSISGGLFLGTLCLIIPFQLRLTKPFSIFVFVYDLIYLATMISYHILFFQEIWLERTITQNMSGLIFVSGHFMRLTALLLFLFSWLKQKPLQPEAGILDPSPEPAPVLGAAQSLSDKPFGLE